MPDLTKDSAIKEAMEKYLKAQNMNEETRKRHENAITNFLRFTKEIDLGLMPAPFVMGSTPTNERVLPYDVRDYEVSKCPKFVQTRNEFEFFDMLVEIKKNGLLIGDKGIAKTLSVARYCFEKKIPLVTLNCSEQTRRSDLIGRLLPIDMNTVKFELGVFPMAIDIANQKGICIVDLEEINALPQSVQKMINSDLDWRKGRVVINEIKKKYELKDDSKLIIVGTMNYSHYGGVYKLTDDLSSRFVKKPYKYPSKTNEKKMLDFSFIDNPELIERILQLTQDTRKAYKENQLSSAISTRELDNFLQILKYKLAKLGATHETDALKEALIYGFVNVYEEDADQQYVIARIESNLAITIKSVDLE